MLKGVLKSVLRVLAGTIFILALAATIGIPAGKRGPAAAQPGDEPRGPDLQGLAQELPAPEGVWIENRESHLIAIAVRAVTIEETAGERETSNGNNRLAGTAG